MESIIDQLLENAPWLIVILLATVNERLVEVFFKRFFEKFKWDTFWLLPITWVTGLGIGLLSPLNLFPDVFRWEWVGWVLTAIFIGAGSNFIHEIYEIAASLKELLRVKVRNGG